MTERCPNTFNHPDWICAIAAHIPGSMSVKVPPSGIARLTSTVVRHALPLPHAQTWVTPLSNTGLPAAAFEPTSADASALLDATESPVLFRNLPLDHPTTHAMLDAAAHVKVVNQWQRAVLNLSGSYENWLQTNFDQKRRKELKRLRARLSEQGKLESMSLKPGEDIQPFIAALLKLESESWKGQRGTAMANSVNVQKALEAGLATMHAANRIKFWQINFNGEPIAALFALVDDGEVTLGKIASSAEYAKSSPGVLIILDATAELLDDGRYVRADSNAMPNHPMIDRIWRDRLDCMDVLLAGPSTPTPVFQVVAFYIGTKSALKTLIKRLLAKTLGRKTS